MELLKLEHVSLSYHTPGGETPVLNDISFSLEQGTFTAVVGPSGCGKSTILNLISGLIQPESGRIFIEGKPLSESELNIGYMLQKDHLFEWRTVRSNVLLGLEIQRKSTPESRARVDSLLESYGLARFRDARPSELSGGMRQRAALIRTLALDYQTRLNVSDDIGQIIRKEKKTALLVTHDISEAVSMADRVIILSRRPARIRRIVPVVFEIPDRTPMTSRDAPEFKEYFNLIWKELNSHE